MKTLVVSMLTVAALALGGTAKVQSGDRFAAITDHGNLLQTGNTVNAGLQACDSLATDKTNSDRDAWECGVTMGYIYGVWRMLYDSGTIHPPVTGGTVTVGQDMAVVRKYFSDHPELLNQPSATLIAQAYTLAWGKPPTK